MQTKGHGRGGMVPRAVRTAAVPAIGTATILTWQGSKAATGHAAHAAEQSAAAALSANTARAAAVATADPLWLSRHLWRRKCGLLS